MIPEEKFVDVSHLAKRWGVAVNTVWRWARTRPEFPKPVRLGPSCTRWRHSQIETFENLQGGSSGGEVQEGKRSANK